MIEVKKGSCHCGAVKFEVELDGGIGEIRRCNCSLCQKKGAIMASVKIDKLVVTEGKEYLSLYQWNTKVAKHYFCKNCGIYTHHQRRSAPDEFAFNVACLAGKDVTENAEIVMLNGAGN
ncbi:aldehyde-activating protein [Colwellia sp. 39_35_sub15_T18]|nr:aldehyde-activating protein [Colwellia sp. 39_35_sub15_T18]